MPLSIEGKPFCTEKLKSGLLIANNPVIVEDKAQIARSMSDYISLSAGEVNYYTSLRVWMDPVLEESKLSVSSIIAPPKDLPQAIKDNNNMYSHTAWVVNTFPSLGLMWTTYGLMKLGKLKEYRMDNLVDFNNDRICVPTAMIRMGLIGRKYYNAWKSKITKQGNPTISKRVEWTGHTIAVKPHSSGLFIIGDQYGTGLISEEQLVGIAKDRNAFQQEFTYHLQVFKQNVN